MIRQVTLDDAQAITNIYNEYILHSTVTFETEAIKVEEMRKRIETISACFPYYVYEKEGECIGYAYAHLWHERAAYAHTWETTVYVSSSHLHQGIGSLLMAELIHACRQGGAHALIACITHENEGSCALHQKLGFKQVSLYQEVGFKFGRWLDVADWELLLP